MRQRCFSVVLAATLAAGWASPARAVIGLAARFGDVVLENVAPGRTYNLREAAHVPFGMQNIGDAPVTIEVDFSFPSKAQLSKNYEPIPDPSWLKAIPNTLTIGPHSIGFFDLLLSVPDDPKLKGKNFEVMVTGRMKGSGMLALAVENKIRFSIGPGPKTLQEEKRQKAMRQLDFDVRPDAIYLSDVPVGRDYDAWKAARKVIHIANYASDPLDVAFKAQGWDSRLSLPDGYEPIPDPSWIVFRSSHVAVEPDEIGRADFILRIPKQEKYRGKKYAAVIRTALSTGFWLDAPVKLYVQTKP